MKIKLKTEIEKEIEIELPYYFKLTNGVIADSYFAILSENHTISNWRSEDIVVTNYSMHISALINTEGFVEISKEEFKTALTQSCNYLINLV